MASNHTDRPESTPSNKAHLALVKRTWLLPGQWQQGLQWALLTPVFLGIVPVLAKVAFAAGVDVLTVVVFRTIVAASLLWTGMLLFSRQQIQTSYPVIVSSLLAGSINGVGSLFFYGSLNRLDASLGQLVNISYLIFVTLLLRFHGHTVSLLTLFRTGLAVFAIYLLAQGGIGDADWLGVGMMFVAALMFALQLFLSQRILYDVPAATMTLYAITAMAIVVTIAWAISPSDLGSVTLTGWQSILLMGLITALSRLTLFLGVKHLGSIQTALMGVMEVIVTIGIAFLFLGERLTAIQWTGATILIGSVLLVRFEQGVPKFIDWWPFLWLWRKHDDL